MHPVIDLTEPALRAFAPRIREEYTRAFLEGESMLEAAGLLATSQMWCHFIAQLAHESAGLSRDEEVLSYSAERIVKVWPKRFRGGRADALPFESNPELLAERVYGRRTDLGNTRPGDGWRYRGRGLIQITGRDNYARFGSLIKEPLEDEPDRAADGPVALRIAVAYWIERGCSPLADRGDLVGVTRAINGALHGLEDRQRWYRKALEVWPEASVPHQRSAPDAAPSTAQIVVASRSQKVGTGALAVTGAVAAIGQSTGVPSDMSSTVDAVQELGGQATELTGGLTPLLGLWKLVASNLWPTMSGVLALTVAYLLWRNWRARKEGRHL